MVEGPKVKLKRERLLQQIRQRCMPQSLTLSCVVTYSTSQSPQFLHLSNHDVMQCESDVSSLVTLKDRENESKLWQLLCIVVVGKEMLICFSTPSTYINSLISSRSESAERDEYHEQADWSLLENLYIQKMNNVESSMFELFMIRIHFGMNGSERLIFSLLGTTPLTSNDSSKFAKEHETFARSLIPQHSRKKLSTVICLKQSALPVGAGNVGRSASTDDISLYLFDSVVTIVEHPFLKLKHLLSQRYYDVMNSSDCDFTRIKQKLQHDKRPIQETVLDQDILPGVGNIIKCEALFRCNIHPEIPSCSLPNEKHDQLIHALQDFSWEWYYATKSKGKDVAKQVYGKSQCSLCQHPVSLVRFAGKTSYQRITYFCSICQPLNGSHSEASLASNVGVVNSARSKRSFSECQQPSQPQENSNIVRWICSFCNFDNVHVLEREENNSFPNCTICGELGPADLIEGATNVSNGHKTDRNTVSLSREENLKLSKSVNVSHVVSTLQTLKCQCGKAASLQRVRNTTSVNLHRLFWSCANNIRGSRCSFFAWADKCFPQCSQQKSTKVADHNGKSHFTILRRVLKPGKNNGRYFYTCSHNDCEFFQWENGSDEHEGSFYQGSIPL